MREKFGFDFFDDIIDHSYDNISSDKERFYSIIKEIKDYSIIDRNNKFL